MTDKERWAPVVGYEQFYLVSTIGQVWRLERTVYRIHTGPYVQKAGLMARRPGNKNGHLCVTLYDEFGRRRKHWIHRLVAEAWIPNPRNFPFVLHGRGGPADNSLPNLRWGNQSENELDKRRHMIARQTEREMR